MFFSNLDIEKKNLAFFNKVLGGVLKKALYVSRGYFGCKLLRRIKYIFSSVWYIEEKFGAISSDVIPTGLSQRILCCPEDHFEETSSLSGKKWFFAFSYLDGKICGVSKVFQQGCQTWLLSAQRSTLWKMMSFSEKQIQFLLWCAEKERNYHGLVFRTFRHCCHECVVCVRGNNLTKNNFLKNN